MYFLILLLFFLAVPSIFKAWRDFRKEVQIKQVEEGLPDILVSLSSHLTSFEKTLAHTSTFNSPAALPFKKANQMIAKGAPVKVAITKSFSSYSSIVSKAGDLLWLFYIRGNSVLPLIKEFALELRSLQESREQLKADSAIHKYSLLVSCALLVPLVIALIYSVASTTSRFMPSNPLLQQTVFLAVNFYLLILAFVCSRYLADQFASHFLRFFSITAPVSLLVFNLVTVVIA